MNKRTFAAFLCAAIWGTAFVAQSVGADVCTPWLFTAARAAVASAVLFAASLFVVLRRKNAGNPVTKPELVKTARYGVLCGALLSAASVLQQAGVKYTGAGKAGFLTALYIIIVPLLGILIGKKTEPRVIFSVVPAVCGLYLLCINGKFRLSPGDGLLLGCALVFAIHIIAVDRFVPRVDAVLLSFFQFLTVFLISLCGTALFEKIDLSAVALAAVPVIYSGAMSNGLAYTLQIYAQKDSNPTVISLIMSFESVFAVLAGAVLLDDRLSLREYAGCALMFAAVVLTILPKRTRKRGG